MKKKLMSMVTLAVLFVGAINAQTTLTLKLGGAFPMGDFGDATVDRSDIDRWGLIDRTKKGGAGTGIAFGAEWKMPISSVQGLGVTVALDAIYNGLNSDINDAFSEGEENAEYDEFSLTAPRYFNVPLTVGLLYQYELTNNLSLFADAGVGANLRLITPFSVHGEYRDDGERYEYDEKYSYDPTASLAFRLGAGITINNKYTITVEYYSLGAAKVKGTYSYEEYSSRYGSDRDKDNFKLGTITPTVLMLRLGIKL